MSHSQIAVIVALCVYALYRQTIRHTIDGHSRFKIAIIYAAVGLIMGGFHPPATVLTWTLLAVSVGLSAVVGYARGRLTHVWSEQGQVYAQGTALTITLFVLLIAFKFALGAAEYFIGTPMHGGFGETLILIAVMAAFQAHIVWRRAQALLVMPPVAGTVAASTPATHPAAHPLSRTDTLEGR